MMKRFFNECLAHGRLRLSVRASIARSRKRMFVVGSCLMFVGCASPPGPLFEPLADPIHWPPLPETPRIAYIGALSTNRDLKPGRSFLESVGTLLFGDRPIEAMASPLAITSDDNGRVFIADSAGRLVHVYDLETRRYEQWQPAGGFALPVGVAWRQVNKTTSQQVNKGGALYVTDSAAGTIYVFDERGEHLRDIGATHLQRPTGIAVDSQNDRIFVADTAAHQLVVLDLQGNLIERRGERGVGSGEFNFPTNAALSQHALIVADSLNFRVQVFDRDLNFIRQVGARGNTPGHFSNPKGIALDSDGHIYIVDAHFEAVQIFNDEGQLLLVFGNEGRGPGEFWLPAGLHIDSQDRIWVADSYNRRVQVFQYLKEAQP